MTDAEKTAAREWAERNFAFIRDYVQPWLGVKPDGKAGEGETIPAWEAKTGGKRSGTEPGSSVQPSLEQAIAVARAAFPKVPLARLQKHVPLVIEGLRAFGIYGSEMLLMALATIKAETAGFEPISEYKSRYNTSPNGHPFDLYDDRSDLGNRGAPDGERYRGRGFVQLTGRDNYKRIGEAVGVDLLTEPDLANDPRVAARILAAFLERHQARIHAALRAGDLKRARRLINGGSHGLSRFRDSLKLGNQVLGNPIRL